ncbi:hypothetical protein SpCBS45565_g03467 [Spizellomyces sp. 'palustris']|nr:hypothetical protein SpCBS45565_g03467 [Spizellomyces sp. 'palustris']
MLLPSNSLLAYLRTSVNTAFGSCRTNRRIQKCRHSHHGLPPHGTRRKKVILGMSGGVDSSVSAYMLLKEGYEVEGVYMRNWDERDENGVCPSEEDWKDVLRVCDKLGIKSHRVDFSKEYWINVFDAFLENLAMGRTPNPDIACNREIKFGSFFDRFIRRGDSGEVKSGTTAFDGNDQYAQSRSSEKSIQADADLIATGHYARLHHLPDGRALLLRAVDKTKDQTYYLSTVPSTALQRTLFPIGAYLKSTVKRIAAEAGLHTAAKRESMGICFVGKRDFGDFIDDYLVQRHGAFVSVDGEVKGEHRGISKYTIGQRARIPGEVEKWYVAEKDPKRNIIYIASGRSHPALCRRSLGVKNWHWVSGAEPVELCSQGSIRFAVKYRYRMDPVPCMMQRSEESQGGYDITLDEPQNGLAMGQHVVAYVGDICLGGGTIDRLGKWMYDKEVPSIY